MLTTPRKSAVGRYAPSPTGDLHLGNLRTALVAWQECRQLGGLFILRIEDIDAPRTVPGSEQRLIDDLRWLGIDWDEGPDIGGPAGPYRQSERVRIYKEALDQLRQNGLVYSCRCSRKELRSIASAPHGPDGPVYPGTCRPKLPTDSIQFADAEIALRFRVDQHPIVKFEDLEAGPQSCDLESESGDFVVRRRDGLWSYQLACAVDDALMGVTHVVRGQDLLSSTPRQIAIMRALELPIPQYRHIPLVNDETGQRMSKRDDSVSLRRLQEHGMTPEDARNFILSLG
jgi:glutamyl-tRNA synthetase